MPVYVIDAKQMMEMMENQTNASWWTFGVIGVGLIALAAYFLVKGKR